MDPVSTRQRLMQSAEYLIAQKGVAATSVREITDAADANVASVNYYFGGKTELVLELLKSRFTQLDNEVLARLTEAEQTAADGVPDIPAVVRAYFDALTNIGFDQSSGQENVVIRLFRHTGAELAAVSEQAQDYTAPGIIKLTKLLTASVPAEKRESVNMQVLIGLMYDAAVTAMPPLEPKDKAGLLSQAIQDFTAAGVQAYLHRISDKT